MCTFPTSIFVLIICAFSSINRVSPVGIYDALVIILDPSIPHHVKLPFKAEESRSGEIVYPDIKEFGEKMKYSYLCRPQTSKNIEALKGSLKTHPEAIYCLIPEMTKNCGNETKPIFAKGVPINQVSMQCGKETNHISHYFGFNYCTFTDVPGSDVPNLSQQLIPIYQICFDTTRSETLWTSHKVQTSLMLQPPGLPSQQIQTPQPQDLSTEPFYFYKTKFSKIAKKYINQKSKYRMVPQLLVPHEDLALKIWKKTTTHYLNTAPLWENLVPLMNAINDGIRKASIKQNLTPYVPDPDEELQIFTTTITIPSHTSRLKRRLNKLNLFKNEQFGLNIWCKFVYDPITDEGVMIYLHNSPENPPLKTDSQRGNAKAKLEKLEKECDNPVPCNFKKWSSKPEELSDEFLEYAYCCIVDNEKVNKLFNLSLTDEIDLLDIDSLLETDSDMES